MRWNSPQDGSKCRIVLGLEGLSECAISARLDARPLKMLLELRSRSSGTGTRRGAGNLERDGDLRACIARIDLHRAVERPEACTFSSHSDSRCVRLNLRCFGAEFLCLRLKLREAAGNPRRKAELLQFCSPSGDAFEAFLHHGKNRQFQFTRQPRKGIGHAEETSMPLRSLSPFTCIPAPLTIRVHREAADAEGTTSCVFAGSVAG